MLRERRRGRPTAPLGVAHDPLTSRLRRLVDDVHDGNLLEASVHAGLPYATLREIHTGRHRRTQSQTLERLAQAYGVSVEWFLDASSADDGTVPLAGWVGFLPGPLERRRVTIPYAAWPLIRVLVFLDQRLRDLPATATRPIIGAATDPREIRNRLTAFVLQPLLAARAIGAARLDDERSADLAGADHRRWVDMLSDLGRFWERALVGLYPELDAGVGLSTAPRPW